MTEKLQLYKCNVCGNIVLVLHPGVGELVCCGQPMKLKEEKTEDPEIGEKHLPIIEESEKGIKVKVSTVEHPMEEEHHIEWIEVTVDGKTQRKFLKPGEKPEALFCLKGEKIEAREYCNVHGLWKNEQK
ncbi:MAG: desulfoferrodoxin [Candidatus Aenigmatarchaeota archaeon]